MKRFPRFPFLTLAACLTAAPSFATTVQMLTQLLPYGTVGQPYSFQLQATGGSGKYLWELTANAPPSGITLSLSGLLSGTPTSAGSTDLHIVLQDALTSATVYNTLTLSFPSVATSSLPPAVVGSPYSTTISLLYAPPMTLTATGLPPGLSVQGYQIVGTPTQAGTYSVGLTASGTATSATGTLPITVAPPLAISNNGVLPAGNIGIYFSQTIAASGGVPPYAFNVNVGSVLPPGISLSANGVLSGIPTTQGATSVSVRATDSTGANASQVFRFSFGAAISPLSFSATGLSFSGVSGGTVPFAKSIAVASIAGYGVTFVPSIVGGPPGLFGVSGQQTAPSILNVGVSPTAYATLTPGAYGAQLSLAPQGTVSTAPVSIPVSLTVASAPAQLAVAPAVLRFVASAGSPGRQDLTLSVQNAGSGNLDFSASASSLVTAISPGAGRAAPNAPAYLTVSVDSTGLAPGVYYTTLHVASVGGSVDVPVELSVAPAGPTMSLNRAGVRFTAAQAAAGVAQSVAVLNTGDASSQVNWSASVVRGGDWLTLQQPASGTAVPGAAGTLLIMANSSVATSAVPRYALVRVTNSATPWSPLYVSAVFDPSPAPPLSDPSPGGVSLTASPFSGPTGAQQVTISSSASAAMQFQVASSTTSGGSWLLVSSPTNVVSQSSPVALAVAADASSLGAGVYTGNVTVSIGGAIRYIPVTLVVHGGPCTPTKPALAPVWPAGGFAATSGLPVQLGFQLSDDCGNPITNASITATFSNGDAPAPLENGGSPGLYTADWLPGAASSQVVVTATAALPALGSAQVRIDGSVALNSAPPPQLAPGGILNNSNPRSFAGLAPGTVAQVFGQGLATAAASPGTIPLVSTFNGTEILVGGLDAPLYYVSSTQVNAQIPTELPPGTYSVVAISNGAISEPQTLDVTPVSPGVSSYSDGRAIAQHGDFSLVSTLLPARPGEVIAIYLTGMGATATPLASGRPSPATLVTQQPVVTVDGQNADVLYAGATPGGVGLYQIDFRVPASARNGSLNIGVAQGGVAANVTTLPVAAP